METNRKLSVHWLLVMGVLVAGLNAKPASAQVLQGKFTLPSEARWGLATLPAGDYSFKLDRGSVQPLVAVYRGARCVALILPSGTRDTTSDRAEIVLQGGIVRELSLPQIRETVRFPAHNPRHRIAPEESQVAQIIPVAVAGAGR